MSADTPSNGDPKTVSQLPADASAAAPGDDVAAVAASERSASTAQAQASTWASPPDAPSATGADAAAASGGSRSLAESLPVGSELAQQKPEVLVGGAFVLGFVVARVLKRITTGE